MLNFKYLGHACIILSADNFSLITDPWFGYPIYSFHAFPDIKKPTASEMNSINAIHISHIHQDHFCPHSLKEFNLKTTIYISKYVNQKLRDCVFNLGFENIIEIAPWGEAIQAGPFALNTFTPTVFNGSFDSSLMVTYKNEYYYFMNDCHLEKNQYQHLKKYYKKITGCFLSLAAINPYPICYNLDNNSEWKSVEMNRIEKFQEQHYLDFCNDFSPVWSVPYANSMRFFYEEIFDYNTIFEKFINFKFLGLEPETLHVSHGDVFDSKGTFIDTASNDIESLKDKVVSEDSKLQLPIDDVQRLGEIFRTFLNRNSKQWTQPIKILIQVPAKPEDLNYNYHFDGETIKNLVDFLGPVDMKIQYFPRAVLKLLSGCAFNEIHYSYLFKVFILHPKKGQMKVHAWT